MRKGLLAAALVLATAAAVAAVRPAPRLLPQQAEAATSESPAADARAPLNRTVPAPEDSAGTTPASTNGSASLPPPIAPDAPPNDVPNSTPAENPEDWQVDTLACKATGTPFCSLAIGVTQEKALPWLRSMALTLLCLLFLLGIVLSCSTLRTKAYPRFEEQVPNSGAIEKLGLLLSFFYCNRELYPGAQSALFAFQIMLWTACLLAAIYIGVGIAYWSGAQENVGWLDRYSLSGLPNGSPIIWVVAATNLVAIAGHYLMCYHSCQASNVREQQRDAELKAGGAADAGAVDSMHAGCFAIVHISSAPLRLPGRAGSWPPVKALCSCASPLITVWRFVCSFTSRGKEAARLEANSLALGVAAVARGVDPEAVIDPVVDTKGMVKTEAAVKAARAAHEKAGGAVAAATEPDARSKAEAALSLCKQELDAAQGAFLGACFTSEVFEAKVSTVNVGFTKPALQTQFVEALATNPDLQHLTVAPAPYPTDMRHKAAQASWPADKVACGATLGFTSVAFLSNLLSLLIWLGYMVVYYSCDMYEVDGKIYMPHTGGICGAGFTAELLRFLALEFLVLGSAILLHEFGVPDFFAAIMVLGRGSYSKLGQERLWTSHLSSYFYAAYLVSSITNGSPLNFITNWPAGSLAAALGEAAISSQPYWLDSFVMRALVLPVLKLLMPVLPGLVCAILAFLVLTALAMVALALALLPSSAGWLALGAARPLGLHPASRLSKAASQLADSLPDVWCFNKACYRRTWVTLGFDNTQVKQPRIKFGEHLGSTVLIVVSVMHAYSLICPLLHLMGTLCVLALYRTYRFQFIWRYGSSIADHGAGWALWVVRMSYVHLLGAQLVTYCAAVHKEATSSMLALLVMGVPALMVSYWKLQPQLQLAATERDRLAVLRCGANSTIDPKGVALLYMPPVQQRGRQLAEKLGLTDLLSRADKAAAAWQRLFVPAPPEAAPATPPAPAAGDSLNSTPSSPCSGMLGAALGLVAMRGDENTPLLANRPHSFEIEAASPAASPAARALQPAQPK